MKNNKIRTFYPEGTDLKRLAKNFVDEYKEKLKEQQYMRRNYMTQDEFFRLSNKIRQTSEKLIKDCELW
tara:strand:- start:134 stop:340 length:207 start_codon:yes stop_codon:yes gene_type:complete